MTLLSSLGLKTATGEKKNPFFCVISIRLDDLRALCLRVLELLLQGIEQIAPRERADIGRLVHGIADLQLLQPVRRSAS